MSDSHVVHQPFFCVYNAISIFCNFHITGVAQPLRLEEQNRGPFYFDVEDEEDLLEEYGASSAEVVTMKEVATRKANTPGFLQYHLI